MKIAILSIVLIASYLVMGFSLLWTAYEIVDYTVLTKVMYDFISLRVLVSSIISTILSIYFINVLYISEYVKINDTEF